MLNAASWPTGSCACDLVLPATTSWSPSAANGAAPARHAGPSAWRRLRTPCGSRHPSCAGAPVGPLSAHPAAPGAASTAQAGYTRSLGCAPRDHPFPAQLCGREDRRGLHRPGHADRPLRFDRQSHQDLHCLLLDGVYRCGTEGAPQLVELPASTDEALQAVLHKIITRTMKLLTRRGGAGRRRGATYITDNDGDQMRPACSGGCRLQRALTHLLRSRVLAGKF